MHLLGNISDSSICTAKLQSSELLFTFNGDEPAWLDHVLKPLKVSLVSWYVLTCTILLCEISHWQKSTNKIDAHWVFVKAAQNSFWLQIRLRHTSKTSNKVVAHYIGLFQRHVSVLALLVRVKNHKTAKQNKAHWIKERHVPPKF